MFRERFHAAILLLSLLLLSLSLLLNLKGFLVEAKLMTGQPTPPNVPPEK